MRKLTASLILLLIASAPLSAIAAETDREPPSIIVSGEGHMSAKPDLATADIGVVQDASTAKEALAANSQAMTQLLKTVADHGIADRDVQTGNFSVSPTYSSVSTRTPHIVGYSVRNSVHVKVRKISELGPLLDDVVQSGANQIHSVNFSIEKPSRLLDEARQQAIDDARRKATIYAGASGVKLGKVLYVIEGGANRPQPIFRGAMMYSASAGAAAAPIMSGEEDLTVSATVVFAIE